MLVQVEDALRTQRAARALPPPPSAPAPPGDASPVTTPPPPSTGKAPRQKIRVDSWAAFHATLVNLALLLPWWRFPLLGLFKVGGSLLYLVQIPLTDAVRRLDYEMRGYVVTDRSLRIRTGVWRVQELTLSFVHLPQVAVSQNRVQRACSAWRTYACRPPAAAAATPTKASRHRSISPNFPASITPPKSAT